MRSIRWLTVLLLLLLPAAAAADILVTKEGGRVETKGPWKVKGAIVVFTQTNGTLSSMRLREVDLDKSAEATAEAKKAAEAPPPSEEPSAEPPPPPKEPVMTVTNKDIPRAARVPKDGDEDEEGGSTGAGGGSAAKGGASEGFEVLQWQARNRAEMDGFEVVGTIKNVGEATARDLAIVVKVTNSEGVFIAERRGSLDTPTLRSNASTAFSVFFPQAENTGDLEIFVSVETR